VEGALKERPLGGTSNKAPREGNKVGQKCVGEGQQSGSTQPLFGIKEKKKRKEKRRFVRRKLGSCNCRKGRRRVTKEKRGDRHRKIQNTKGRQSLIMTSKKESLVNYFKQGRLAMEDRLRVWN